jgi:hypothetical protein
VNNQAATRDAGLTVIEFLMKYSFYPDPFSLPNDTLTLDE